MLDSALSLVALLLLAAPAVRSDTGTFEGVEPILMDLCYDCHGDGMEKGDFAMDKWDSVEEHLKDFFEKIAGSGGSHLRDLLLSPLWQSSSCHSDTKNINGNISSRSSSDAS